METEVFIRLFVAVSAIAGAIKIIYDIYGSGRNKLKEDYQTAKDFLGELESNPKLHHLAVERGYYALAGTSALTVPEIKYLISLSNPQSKLTDYAYSKKYIELDKVKEVVAYKNKYKTDFSRGWRKRCYFIIYVITAFLAFSPLPIIQYLSLPNKYLLFLFMTIPYFGYFALNSLQSYRRIVKGEELVNNQNGHDSLVLAERRGS